VLPSPGRPPIPVRIVPCLLSAAALFDKGNFDDRQSPPGEPQYQVAARAQSRNILCFLLTIHSAYRMADEMGATRLTGHTLITGDFMSRTITMPALLLLGLLLAAGCAAVVAGAGAGAYSYVSGELKRTYPVDFDTAGEAVDKSLAALKISVAERRSTGMETTLSGMRTDQTPVTVTVAMIGPKATEIGIRTGLVGYWDKSGSELIHATIAKQLQ
jgi:hypothetical protein